MMPYKHGEECIKENERSTESDLLGPIGQLNGTYDWESGVHTLPSIAHTAAKRKNRGVTVMNNMVDMLPIMANIKSNRFL